ncbi:MAG TPA: hypothetical protein VFE53_19005 [Mucilaginibacter sp.]|jgi:hypothetical protein|nr:hypothetical protein [Mucilaginibacter sp.]
MKTRFLFPHKWRIAGLLLLLLAALIIADSCFTKGYFDPSTDPGEMFFGMRLSGNMAIAVNDTEYLSVIIGLLLVGFSKEKIEDEQIAQLRLDSLQWSVYFNYSLLIICIILINGIGFLQVMVYNIMSQLLFFIIRFRWKLYQLNKLAKKEETQAVSPI